MDELGDRIKPAYITSAFPLLLERHDLKRIRYHDLRHSCASLLIANGVSMKQIQEWLGHSTFTTTANLYTHLEYDSKLSSADALNSGTAFGRIGIEASEETSTESQMTKTEQKSPQTLMTQGFQQT